MKPGSLKPMVILIILLDIVLICLGLILYFEYGVGMIPCDTDIDCVTKNGGTY